MTAQRTQQPKPDCIHTALFERASIDRDREILVDEQGSISAATLVRRIEDVAAHLTAREAAGRVVGLLIENTIDQAIAYFASLHAGTIVAALPGGAPAVVDRIISNGHLDMLLTDREANPSPQSGVPVLSIDGLMRPPARASNPPEPDPHRPAHLLFTSGTTTGKPRSVITDHVGSMRSHAWRTSLWPYEAHDVVGCNIFGMWDLVPALHAGVPVVQLTDRTIRDPLRLADAITRYGITRMMLTPTLLDACLRCPEAATALSTLRRLVLCGEGIPASLHRRMAKLLPCVHVANLYSLSECHDVAVGELPLPGEPMRMTIAPFAKVLISDENQRDKVVEAEAAGRILVGGPGLARQPSEQASANSGFFRMSADTFGEVDVFDTGDRGRITSDGSLEVFGRCGSNVKIRGTWVNPREVEAVLERHPGVGRACVTNHTNAMGHLSLVAHIVPDKAAGRFEVTGLRRWLCQRLHPAAIPGQIIPRESLPLMATGKVDLAQLVLPVTQTEHPDEPQRHAGGSILEEVRAAFRKVLGRSDLADEDSFNNLGGDSLAAVALCVEVERRTGRALASSDLKPADTPTSLAARLSSGNVKIRSTPPPEAPTLSSLPRPLNKPSRHTRTILVTGATGGLGQHVVRQLASTTGVRALAVTRSADRAFPEGVHPVAGDLSLAQLGWSDATFDAVASEIDTVIHLAADMDLLGSYAAMRQINVMGTETLIRLTARAGANLIMASSSAVFPLHFGTCWSESFHGSERLREQRVPLIASGADGYSLTKHDAETLAWQAAEDGLPVHVVRLPHLLAPNQASRLFHVAKAWANCGLMPEGPWQWQIAPPMAAAEALLAIAMQPPANARPVTHIALDPIPAPTVQKVIESLGSVTRTTTIPASAAALYREGNLDALIRRYGPAAAMCINEPMLETSSPLEIDPADYLMRCLRPNDGE